MPLEFIDLNFSPVVAVNCDYRKVMGEKNGTKVGLKNKKMIIKGFGRK